MVFLLHSSPEKSCKGNSGAAAQVTFANATVAEAVCLGVAGPRGVAGALKAGVSPRLRLAPLPESKFAALARLLEGLTHQKSSALAELVAGPPSFKGVLKET